MGTQVWKIALYAFLSVAFLGSAAFAVAQSLADRLAGRILIQTEGKGEGWYVNPADRRRYYLGTPAQALEVMKRLGLGITNADLAQIPIGGSLYPPPVATTSVIMIDVDEKGVTPPTNIQTKRGRTYTLVFRVANKGVGADGMDFMTSLGKYVGVTKPGESRTFTFTATRTFTITPLAADHSSSFPYQIRVVVLY